MKHPYFLPFLLFFQLFFVAKNTANDSLVRLISLEGRALQAENGVIHLETKSGELRFHFIEKKTDETYFFRMDNLDMRACSTQNQVIRYSTLPSGRFNFVAWRSGAVSKSDSLQVAFVVETPFGESFNVFQMIFLFASCFGFLIFFLTKRYSYRREAEIQQVKIKIAADLHDELGAALTTIRGYIQVIQRKLSIQMPHLLPIVDKLDYISDKSINMLRDGVWTINNDDDTLLSLIAKIRTDAMDMLVVRGFMVTVDNYFLDNDNEAATVKLSLTQRRDLYLMVKETLNNVAKHSKAKTVVIRIGKKSEKELFFSVFDDGIGFDMTKVRYGNGVRILQQRAKESFMNIDIQSELGKGTTSLITVYLS